MHKKIMRTKSSKFSGIVLVGIGEKKLRKITGQFLKPKAIRRVTLVKDRVGGRSSVVVAYEKTGVFVFVMPRGDVGAHLDKDYIIKIINRCSLTNVDESWTRAMTPNGEVRAKIAPAQPVKWRDETFEITFSEDNDEAYGELTPRDKLGKEIEMKTVMEMITKRYAIKESCLDRDAIADMVTGKRYNKKLVIAKGSPCFPAEDGYLQWYINTDNERDISQKWSIVDDRVDFKELHLFETVEAGQLLVKAIPPVEGSDGMNVFGEIIHAKPGVKVKVPSGENVLFSDDMTELYAACGGRVDVKSNWVTVNNRYVVNSDVNLSVGNIDFPGDVIIYGNVLSGFKVKSGGNIEIYGTVEGAMVKAKKKIVLYRGVQGAGKAYIVAGENLRSGFIENAHVEVHGNIYTDSIIQSRVECDGYIDSTKGRGVIVGGHVRSARYIVTRTIGSTGNIPTKVELGLTTHMTNQLAECKSALEKCERKIHHLQSFGTEPNENTTLRFKNEISVIERSKFEKQNEIYRILEQQDEIESSKVHVLQAAHTNTTIVINGAIYKVRSQIKFTSFLKQKDEVNFVSCMYDPSQAPVES